MDCFDIGWRHGTVLLSLDWHVIGIHAVNSEEGIVTNELYLLIGALIGFIYALAAAAIVVLLGQRKQTKQTTLGDLRSRLAGVQEEIQAAQEQVWAYGSGEEEKGRRWRIACTTMAAKAADVLQSCWLGREEDPSASAIYDELLMGLKSVGLEEIRPSLGQEVGEDDRDYRIKHKEGAPPYRVSKLLCPGYSFKLASDRTAKAQRILIEPAKIEVIGENSDHGQQ